jgi:hypothetical protein
MTAAMIGIYPPASTQMGGYSRAEPIGAYVTSGDRLPNGCVSTGSLLRAAHATAARRSRDLAVGYLTEYFGSWPED